MANRIEIAMSLQAIYSHAAGEGLAQDVLAADIGRTLGGKDTITGPAYGGTVLSNINATSATTLVAASAGTSCVWIKHRGLDDTGAVSADVLTVLVAGTAVGKLNAGGCMILPQLGSANAAAAVTGTSSGSAISVEVADID